MAKAKKTRYFSLDLTEAEARALWELLQTEKWPTEDNTARAQLNRIWLALYGAYLNKGGY